MTEPVFLGFGLGAGLGAGFGRAAGCGLGAAAAFGLGVTGRAPPTRSLGLTDDWPRYEGLPGGCVAALAAACAKAAVKGSAAGAGGAASIRRPPWKGSFVDVR